MSSRREQSSEASPDSFGIAFHLRRRTAMHHRPSGISSGLSTVVATAWMGSTTSQPRCDPAVVADQQLDHLDRPLPDHCAERARTAARNHQAIGVIVMT